MNVTSIIDFSQTHLEIINDGKTIYVKKAYIEVAINPDDSRIVDMFWHWYEFNDHQRLFYLDFAIVTTPVAANAAALLALIQGYITSQYGGSVADASETVKGVVEEATQAEVNAYTDTGATGAQLFVVPSKLKVWIEQAALTIDAIWHFVSAKLRLFNAAKTFYVAFTTAATANRSQAFPDKDGTIALTSDTLGSLTFNHIQQTTPLDAQVTYFGTYGDRPLSATAATRQLYFPVPITIVAVSVSVLNTGVLATTEASTIALRINNTTDHTLINTVTYAAASQNFNATGLSIAVAAGDLGEAKLTYPTWITNPTGVTHTLTIWYYRT